MLPIRNIPYLLPMCCSFLEKCKNSPGVQYPLKAEIMRIIRIPSNAKYTGLHICHIGCKCDVFIEKVSSLYAPHTH